MDRQLPSVASGSARWRGVVALVIGLSLLGCGQKGALTLPTPLPPLPPPPAAAAASAPLPGDGNPAVPVPRP